MFKLDR